MGTKGVWVFQRWLRDELAADVPLDQMVRQIVARAGLDLAESPVELPPHEPRPDDGRRDRGAGLPGYSAPVRQVPQSPVRRLDARRLLRSGRLLCQRVAQGSNNLRREDLDKHEINGDEFVYLSGRPEMVQPRTRKLLAPTLFRGRPFPVENATSNLDHLADWLTRDNRQFTRNLANRIWFHLLGRGIVDPVDDFRESNPPSNPALLNALSNYLGQHGMRLKPMVGLIMKSQTYQLDGAPNPTNEGDTANFARASVRLLPAEVLLDAISQVLDVADPFEAAPYRLRATQLPGIAEGNPFLKAFGKPERLLTCECERIRVDNPGASVSDDQRRPGQEQAGVIGNRIAKLLDRKATDETILGELYLAALCREPTAAERKAILSRVKASSAGDRCERLGRRGLGTHQQQGILVASLRGAWS